MRPRSRSFIRHPSDILGSPSTIRIATDLARHGGELTASELARRAGITRMNATRALKRLAGAGLAERVGSEHAGVWRSVRSHPLTAAVEGIAKAEDERFDEVLRAVSAAAGPSRIEAAWLYGSVARGDDAPGSDVDIAVLAADGAGTTAAGVVREALRASEDRLGVRYSVVAVERGEALRLAASGNAWWTSMCDDAVPILGDAPDVVVRRLRPPSSRDRSPEAAFSRLLMSAPLDPDDLPLRDASPLRGADV
jgi:predicted nucleotidyltransferase